MRNENWKLIRSLLALYAICTCVVGALCMLLHPLIEFSFWRVTGLFGLVIAVIFGAAARQVYIEMVNQASKPPKEGE